MTEIIVYLIYLLFWKCIIKLVSGPWVFMVLIMTSYALNNMVLSSQTSLIGDSSRENENPIYENWQQC